MEKLLPQMVGAVLISLMACGAVGGENPQPAAVSLAEQHAALQQRLQEMDSPCYETRHRAVQQVERWLGMPETAAMLAERFQQLIVEPELSFEVRWQITLWRKRLPPVECKPPQVVLAEEIQCLVRQLDDNAYAVRVGACERLKWMAASERLAQPIVLAVKHRLSDQCLSEDSYRRLESIREAARGFWLTADSADWKWPPASDTQLGEWLEELGRPAASGDPHTAVRRRIAQQDLMDVLCRDEDVPRIKAAIEAHLQGKLDQAPAGRLKELLDLTRPTLVAECWSGRRQTLEQHMIVGQPMYVAGFAAHPSHFDRADDRVAHCVSGNALNPGDYPVGVAFPPPNVANAVFQLNYLPTPRRQIAYSYDRQIDPAIRLARLSRCTLDRFLAEKRLLDDAELRMLAQLDVGEVSRFAGRYFLAVEDGTVEDEIGHEGPATGQGSCFAAICGQLAVEGTRGAVPGLLEAIRRRRFRPPTAASPYRQQWLAALSIARRDPWPEVDTWLAQNIENRQALLITHDEWGRRTSRSASGGGNRQSMVVETDEAAEIGATAAGLLLVRHEQRPEALGLQTVVDTRLSALKLPGFRYRTADDVQRVRQWWKGQAEGREPVPPSAPAAKRRREPEKSASRGISPALAAASNPP